MNRPLYVCYSLPQMIFLLEHGIRYEVEGKHKVTNKDFWVYIRNEELNKYLTQWSLSRK